MKREKSTKTKIGYWILYFTLPVAILSIWQLADMYGMIKPYSMPSLRAIVNVTVDYFRNGKLLENITVSFIRVIEGFAVALGTGLLLGVLVSIFPKLEVLFDLLIQIVRPIPPIAWIPLAVLWFGIGQESKIFIIFLGAFFPIFVNTVDGIQSINPGYFELSAVYEVSKKELVTKVVVPGALPQIMTGIRLGIGNAWVCVVAAEMIGAVSGVGFMLADGRSLSRPDVVVLGMLIVGIVGKLMDDLLKVVRSKSIRWQ